jgi:hypothetical protein
MEFVVGFYGKVVDKVYIYGVFMKGNQVFPVKVKVFQSLTDLL